jgi:glycosyltransferase involved in cell wall biosynthesis
MTEELAKLNAIRVIMLGRKTWFERIGSLSFPQLSVESKYSMGTFGITPSIVSDFLTKNKNLSGVIHLHGMCSSFNLLLGASAKKSALPVIMHPHGMLMPWALRQHMLRKRIALSLFYRRHLSQVKAFIATSELEFEELRNFGLTQPVAVIPNGITLACTQEKKEKFDLMTNNSIRTALFLSRMAPVKGLEDLLNAWNSLKPHGWRLMLAGPDENGYLSKVLEMIRQLRLENSVEYVGVIQGHRKSEIFKRADLFVLPSYSENFGIVIAEALSAGLPVITTQSTPWKTLQSFEWVWATGTG